MKKRIVSVLLLLCMLTGAAGSLGITVGAATVSGGMTFTATDQYEIPYVLDVEKPASGDEAITVEMEVWFDPATGNSTRTGSVVGSYDDSKKSDNCFEIEIHSYGYLRVYMNQGVDVKFPVDLRTYMGTADAPTFAKIAVVVNATTQTLTLYVNGEKKSSKTDADLVSGSLKSADRFILGGDRRTNNTVYFKGNIKSLAMWSDVRSATEIAADAAKTSFSVESDSALLFAYDLSRTKLSECFTDLSGNGYDIPYELSVPGMTFTADTTYEVPYLLNVEKNASGDEAITAEMEFHYSPALTGRVGSILGTFESDMQTAALTFEAYSNGRFRVHTMQAGDYVFNTDLRPYMGTEAIPKYVKVAVVINVTQRQLTLYVNGQKKETKKGSGLASGDLILPDNFLLGGDLREGNTNYFKGDLKNLAVWSDVRTDAEIAADAAKETFSVDSDSALLFAYDLSKDTQTARFTDLSGNGRHVVWKPQEGKTFVLGSLDRTAKNLPVPPKTVEATIYVPTSVGNSTRAGVIIGNLDADANGKEDGGNLDLEIYKNGNPRFYYNRNTSIVFDKVDVRKYGDWVNLAIVFDDSDATTNYIRCYVNGELAQEKTHTTDYASSMNDNDYCIGSDFRAEVTQQVMHPEDARFKGYIKDVTLYTDARDGNEIRSDYQNGASLTDENVLAAWDFTASNSFRDLTGNGYDIFNEDDGITFTQDELYRTTDAFSAKPYTFETWLHLPTSYSKRAGVIFGNVTQEIGQTNSLCIEIGANGIPRLYYYGASNSVRDYKFTEVDVRGDGWTHLAIVLDPTTKEAHCYLNGVWKQTLTGTPDYHSSALGQMALGGDMRDQRYPDDRSKFNQQYFKGSLHDLALFNDVRTSEEIKADFEQGVSTAASGLISYYDLEDMAGFEKINDAKKKNHLTTAWELCPREDTSDYAYTFAVVGDTQKLIEQDHKKGTTYFTQLYEWIVEHREEKNIQLVVGLGDITENGHKNDEYGAGEWEIAKAIIPSTLGAAGIPYSLIAGNHENPTQLTTYFADEPTLTDNITGYYSDDAATKLGNYYMNVDVGEHKYTIIGIEYGAVDAILDWVGDVADANPDRRVIVTTHSYLFRDGTTTDKNDAVPPDSTGEKAANNGDEMWEKVMSRHRNILMVLSGHDPCENIIYRQDEGEYGNLVTQMLIDPQGMDKTYGYRTGMVALFHFSNDGKELYVEYVSTIRDEYFREENQFHLSLYPEDKGDVYDVTAGGDGSYRVYYMGGMHEDFNELGAIASVSGYQLSLGGKLGVNAYFDLSHFVDASKISVKFTLNGESETVAFSEAISGEHGYGFKGTANASQMTAPITVGLYYGEILLATDEFTIADYARVILENEDNNTEYEAAQELVKSMLRYGSAAQTYFAENTDNLCDALLDENDRVVGEHTEEILSVGRVSFAGALSGVTYASTTLELRDEVSIYHYFELGASAEYTVTCENATVETEVKNGRLIVKILGVDAARLATTYTVSITSGAETFTVSVNAFAYASAAVQSSEVSSALETLMHALYEYYAAATAYGA